MKNCLVTGADGFIGSHLVEKLIKNGYKVRALAQYNSFSNYGWLEDLNKEIQDEVEIILVILDSEMMNSICKDMNKVFNLAALIAIPYSYKASRSYVDTNVIGTLNVLNACRDQEVDIMVRRTHQSAMAQQFMCQWMRNTH